MPDLTTVLWWMSVGVGYLLAAFAFGSLVGRCIAFGQREDQ